MVLPRDAEAQVRQVALTHFQLVAAVVMTLVAAV